MKDVMVKLEEWRESRGLNKTEMARRIGANSSQQYTNWISRNSLPKEFFGVATSILGEDSSGLDSPEATPSYKESLFSQLSDRQKMKVMESLIDEISDKDRARLLAKLISG